MAHDRFAAMQAFVRVVEAGSFSAVARELRTSQPAISKRVAALETRLGAKLLARTTRHLSLTDEGRRYYEQCRRVLDALDEAEGTVRRGRSRIAGTLRVGTAVALGRLKLVPVIGGFLERHPEVAVELLLNDRFVDLVEEGIDVALRIGEVQGTGLIARRIATSRRVIVASPRYLRRRGTPREPRDLAAHNCVAYTGLASPQEWPLATPAGVQPVRVGGNLRVNSPEGLRAAALAGIGLALGPRWLFGDALADGQLKAVLPQSPPASQPIHAVYPESRRQSARVRAFVEFAAEAFARDPVMALESR
jgi:DNA-binding transcriptional LysR family regulator